LTKVIKINDGNYSRLLAIIHELECKSNERASFDDALSLLIAEHEAREKQKLNRTKVTK